MYIFISILLIILIIIYFNYIYTYEYFYAGKKETKEKLNNTLEHISKLLNHNNIKNWFIGYGTLLGIIRENECIEKDDDIDILCNKKDFNTIKQMLIDNGFTFKNLGNTNNLILKTNDSYKYASIDFYFCEVDIYGTYIDKWNNNRTWPKCFKNGSLIAYKWKDTILYLPNNKLEHIKKIYGKTWNIPISKK
jgi:hypothetical protein